MKQDTDKRCIVVTGGGTAGHVYPALSVVENILKRWDGRIVWIGSRSGMEKRLLQGFDLTYYGIPSGKWRRYLSFRNVLDIFKVLAGTFYAIVLLMREKPALLFSKGGYVSVPPVIAAWLLGIPIFTHESDYDPGLANRLNAIFAEKILVSFGNTEGYFERERVVLTGNPVRERFFPATPRRDVVSLIVRKVCRSSWYWEEVKDPSISIAASFKSSTTLPGTTLWSIKWAPTIMSPPPNPTI